MPSKQVSGNQSAWQKIVSALSSVFSSLEREFRQPMRLSIYLSRQTKKLSRLLPHILWVAFIITSALFLLIPFLLPNITGALIGLALSILTIGILVLYVRARTSIH